MPSPLPLVAVRAGFVTVGNNGNSFNPLGTHSLRESFGSLMINSGVPDTIVDFWLGHEIGDMAKAYKETQFENLKKMYLEREHLLAVSSSKGENVRTRAEVKEVKDDLYQLHLENKKLSKEVESLKAQIGSMYDFVHKNFDPLVTFVNSIDDDLLKKIHEKREEQLLKHMAEADKEQPDVGDSQHSSSSKNS